MRIINQTRGTMIAPDARLADNFFTRLRGLLGTKTLPFGQGLLIRPCDSVHTFGMAYAIDVVYLDGTGRVLKCVPSLGTGKISACRRAKSVMELPAGTIAATGMQVSDQMVFQA